MIAASLLSWQLCWEVGNGVWRCCKENETALFRPRFRGFAAHLRALNTKPPATKATALQPYLNFHCTLLSEVVLRPAFFSLSLNPFLYLFFLFHLNDKKILHVRRVSFFFLHAKE